MTATLASRSWGDLQGPKPLALLVHGLSSSSRTWALVGPALTARGFRVLAVDLRGHGGSPRLDGEVSLTDLAAEVAATADARAGGGCDLLLGHSLGALVALELLGGQPGYARRLVLEDPPGPTSLDWVEAADGLASDHEHAVTDPGGLRARLEAENPGWAAGEAARRVADLADCDADAIAPRLRGGLSHDPAKLAAPVDVPTLVVLAEEAQGSLLVGADRAALTGTLRNATVRELPSGHSVHREHFRGFVATLDEWLRGTAAS